jgi:endonuclease YncB( thermonuclease family)
VSRRDLILTCVALAVAVIAGLWRMSSGSARPFARGTVVRAVDGDTIIVRSGGSIEDVRLLGIDTPETVDPRRPVE